MESVGSNSPDPPVTHRQRRHKPPAQALADRISRALHDPLLLLHRSDSTFFVMGSTSNVYNVVLTDTPTCSCPDRAARATRCKHILFVLIRVLGVPPNDPSHRRRNLRPCHLSRLLATATSPDSLARPALRRRFHEIFFRAKTRTGPDAGPVSQRVEVEEGACCPVCLEEMGGRERLVVCRRCRNPVHEECLMRWKRSLGRRWASCVVCRARWRNGAAATEKYLNLAAYLREEDDRAEVAGVGGDAGVGCSGG